MNAPSSLAQVIPGRLHVLQVIGNAIVGGMETHVLQLIAGLPRERFRISALCPFESHLTEQLRGLDVEVHVAPMPEEPLWSSILTAFALVRSGGVDVLHAHLPNAHMLAGLAGRLAGRPVLTTVHGRQLTPVDAEVHHATGSHLLMVCRQSWYHALGIGIGPAQLSCIPNGVDVGMFRPARSGEGDAVAFRTALGIPAEAPVAGFVGRFSPEKGPETFVRAALLLKAMVPGAHAVMVGDGPMQATLEAAARDMGLAGTLHFAGLRREMAPVYRAFDVMLSTSNSEAMPLAVMEAQASGVPVVATRVGGVPDIVEQGRSGYLVGPRDFEGAAQQAARLLRDHDERARMAQRARERALLLFNVTDCIERTGELLTRLAGGLVERAAPARMRAGTEA